MTHDMALYNTRSIIFVFVSLFFLTDYTSGFPAEAYSSEFRYIEKGDINIGAILSIHSPKGPFRCENAIDNIHNIQDAEALSFAVQEINSRTDILPNISLGFVMLDDCLSPSIALARAIQFMPQSARRKVVCPTEDCSAQMHAMLGAHDKPDVFYDVVGVIGTYTSKLSVVVANVLGLFQLPQISHTATSDLLSDKKRFPYFFRMVPPDKYQVQVIASLLLHFNWSHVSLVYSEGSYGREGVKKLRRFLDMSPETVCIEDPLEIQYNAEDEQFDDIISRLRRHSDVRVVVAYVEVEDAKALSRAVGRSGTKNSFIWIGSDTLSLILEEEPRLCEHFPGSLTMHPHSGQIEEFRRHLEALSNHEGLEDSKNPWIKQFVEQKETERYASLESGKNRNESAEISHDWVFRDDGYVVQTSFVESFLIDSVYAYAYALDNVAKQYCAETSTKEALTECVKKQGIFEELQQIRFNGSFGEIKFNKNGDVVGKYDIRQCVHEHGLHVPRTVGYWDMQDETLDMMNHDLSWPGNTTPISACTEPCSVKFGTIYYFTKQTCCWECVQCKVNEIVTSNLTRCESCPEFFWPDDETRSSCRKISPFHTDLRQPLSIGLGAAALIGFLVCLWVGMTLIKYKDEHIIKSTSVDLNSIILLGTSMAYILTASFLSPPNSVKCFVNHVGFSLTFTMVYAPLLVKTNRIYRIFKAGKKTTRKPYFISQSSQIIITLVLICIQVAIVTISTSLTPPEVKLRMPVRTEKFVELFCDLPRAGLLSSLSYNLVLVITCTFYAFKTRKLPDNYKESRYIAFCVDTTLLIWLTFLPTYFTTAHAGGKVAILAVALLLNAYVTLFCLFIPRIHSLYTFMRDPCSPSGHHYKDFRIVKHVVTRKRSLELTIKNVEDLPSRKPGDRVPSAGTLASDVMTQEFSEVIICVSESQANLQEQ